MTHTYLADVSGRRPGYPRPEQHGTRTGYHYGCRCEPCRAANLAYLTAHRAVNPTAWDRRTARVRGLPYEPVTRQQILERDGWVCQLCSKPIDPEQEWPHRLSASIDHIVPVSRGGGWTWANLQAAHLGCNCAKSNRVPA